MDSTGRSSSPRCPPSSSSIGGGYVGLELGTVYAALGSHVTLVEMTDGLLPGVDRDLVQPLARRIEKLFPPSICGSRVTARPRDRRPSRGADRGTGARRFDRVLVAVGRRAQSTGLGLDIHPCPDRRARLHRGRRAVPHRGPAHLRRRRRDRRAHARSPRDAAGSRSRPRSSRAGRRRSTTWRCPRSCSRIPRWHGAGSPSARPRRPTGP